MNNGVEPDRIEFYKHTHYNEGKGWSSVDAETNYDKMKELQSKVILEGERQLTIDEIVDEVLGKKSGYVKGLGYGPKPIANASKSAHRRAIELEEALKRTHDEAANSQRELLDRLNTAETLVDTQQVQIGDLNSQLASVLATQQ